MATIRTYDDGALIASHTATTVYDWAATPPSVTITVTDDTTGNVVSTDTQEVPIEDRERHAIVQTWAQRRQTLVDAYQALQAAEPGIVSANQQVQGATTAAQMLPATKAYASANLQALAAIRDAQQGVLGALGVIEDAMAWLDAELADLKAEEGA